MKNEQEYLDTIDIQHEYIEHLTDVIWSIAEMIYMQLPLRFQDAWLDDIIAQGLYDPGIEDDLTEKKE